MRKTITLPLLVGLVCIASLFIFFLLLLGQFLRA